MQNPQVNLAAVPPWRISPASLGAKAMALEDVPDTRRRVLRTVAGELINMLDACAVPHGMNVVADLHCVGRTEK